MFEFPYQPLLRTFLAEERTIQSRELALMSAQGDWLNPTFLDSADEPTLRGRLLGFYECISDVPFHCDTLGKRVRLVRHGLNHLVRGQDPLPIKVEHCVKPNEAYYVHGLGLSFWSAIAQALDLQQFPRWSPAIERGLLRLNLLKRID